MKFQGVPNGYQKAIETLTARFGNEDSLKRAKVLEIRSFNHNIKTSEGLFRLHELIQGILTDPTYTAECANNTGLLYMEVFSKLGDIQEKYQAKYETGMRNLRTLGDLLKQLAADKKEQENARVMSGKPEHSHHTHKVKHFSSNATEKKQKNF